MTNRNAVIKLGLIGAGRVAGTRHLPALASLPDVEVIAVADHNPEHLNHVANRFNIKYRYLDFLDLLENPAIEAVAVCVPAEFHVEMAMAALDTGKHLFIEKPLALSADECDRLIERARQSPSKAMVGFNMRWHRLVRQAREIIEQQRLGPLELIRTAFTGPMRYRQNVPEWRKRRELGGGALVEMAVHQFDMWRFLLQSEVEEISVMSRSDQWDDNTATMTARMANGLLVSSLVSQGTSDTNEVEVYGKAGRLKLSCYRLYGLELFSISNDQKNSRIPLRRMARMLKELPQMVSVAHQGGPYFAAFCAEWRHFIDCIKYDTPVGPTLEDGQRAVQVVLAAVASASLGQPVKVDYAPRKITKPSIGATS